MNILKRKNSFWQLFGLAILWWGLYILSVLVNDKVPTFKAMLVLIILSGLSVISNWSNFINVLFYEDYFEVKHFFSTKNTKCYYPNIILAQVLFTRVVGSRLVIKYKTQEGPVKRFSIYKPNKELIDFINTHVENFDKRVT